MEVVWKGVCSSNRVGAFGALVVDHSPSAAVVRFVDKNDMERSTTGAIIAVDIATRIGIGCNTVLVVMH